MNFITGATGLLGTHLLLELLRRGEKVRGLKRSGRDLTSVQRIFSFYGASHLFARIEWAEGDVCDILSLRDAIAGCDTVYHCAAVVSYHRKDRDEMYKVNVSGTAHIVNLCLEQGIKRLCHVSSVAAIGREMPDSTLDENSPWVESPLNTHYGIIKHLSEIEVWRGIQEGLSAVMINPGFIIGPGENGKSSMGLFTHIQRGIPAYPMGGTGFIAAGDVAKAMVLLSHGDFLGERFIAVAENLSMREVFEATAEALGVKIPTIGASPLVLHTARWAEGLREFFTGKKSLITREAIKNTGLRFYYDHQKLQHATGIVFTPITDAIRETATFLKEYR